MYCSKVLVPRLFNVTRENHKKLAGVEPEEEARWNIILLPCGHALYYTPHLPRRYTEAIVRPHYTGTNALVRYQPHGLILAQAGVY